jgi:hypothetical protein
VIVPGPKFVSLALAFAPFKFMSQTIIFATFTFILHQTCYHTSINYTCSDLLIAPLIELKVKYNDFQNSTKCLILGFTTGSPANSWRLSSDRLGFICLLAHPKHLFNTKTAIPFHHRHVETAFPKH